MQQFGCSLGLADEASMLPQPTKKRHIKPGESREGKAHQVFIDAEGRQKHVIGLDDKLVDAVKRGVQPGKTMHFLSGRHQGLTCEVNPSSFFSKVGGHHCLQLFQCAGAISRERQLRKTFLRDLYSLMCIVTVPRHLDCVITLLVPVAKCQLQVVRAVGEGGGAQVLALEPRVEGRSDRAAVRLLASNATVTARCSELGEKFEAGAACAVKAAGKSARKVPACRRGNMGFLFSHG